MLIKFPYNKEVISRIREIPGRKWNPDERGWDIPNRYLYRAAEAVNSHYPNIAESIRIYANRLAPKQAAVEELSSVLTPDNLSTEIGIEALQKIRRELNLSHTLFPYQELGVAFLDTVPTRGAIIADAPGLGKTIQTLAWLSLHPKFSTVVVTPASVKRHWARESEKWVPDRSVQVIMSGKDKIELSTDITVVNYDLLWKLKEELVQLNPVVVVFDECTYLKEAKAKRTKAAILLGRTAKYVIGLSGTPIINRPIEFFNILNLIDSKQFPSWFKFGLRYCNGEHNGYGWQFNGTSNTKELQNLIRPFIIRRRKDEVLTELPPKRREVIYIEMPGNIRADYVAAETDLMTTVRIIQDAQLNANDVHNNALAKLGLLRHLVGLAKAEMANDYIKNFIQDGEKLLVFGHHHDVLDMLEDFVKKEKIGYVRVDGQTPTIKRQPAVDKFQTDDSCLVFLASTAMGMGVTLTAASNALFVERQWSPATEEQMEDRLHRIGQEKGVTVWYMELENTIDEKMSSLVESKRELLSALLDKNESTESNSVMKELLADLSR
jgi:SWI/SNF-related matrix-associated actin-dependent regulator 1 of chromatin subfamily A